ncbi:MAG: methionyl-tRNA formyltransferase [Gemmatimonadetes bacterium]|nr:methionyl-tRNA formyltransferase [Gemmatimonadota bacterium]|tara:strand:+ start:635 stop:1567 length:933 start_codon:yes stop_codon:yes gene_type:complete
MRILFWGTPDFAVPSLRALANDGVEIVGVVTQPDRPAGRGRRVKMSPVKEEALALGHEVLAPIRPQGQEFIEQITELRPDLSVVVAYGHILKPEILDLPSLGSVNVHASLLPQLRGAAPVNWAIIRGHEQTGVTVMRMVEAMDAGPIIHQLSEPISDEDSASELMSRLSELGSLALREALGSIKRGDTEEREQLEDAVSYAPKVDRKSARIDWTLSANEVALFIRGMDATPGAWSELAGMPIKFFRPSLVPESEFSQPGAVVRADPEQGLVISTSSGGVSVSEVQPAGRQRMNTLDWINGRGVKLGQHFE